jgi:hypothetical protein
MTLRAETRHMKTCSRCRRTLALSEFNWKNQARGKVQSRCRVCSRAQVRDHYARHTPYYIEKAGRRNAVQSREYHQRVLEFLVAHPCVDCGEDDIVVLQFDHTDRSRKLSAVAVLFKRRLPWRRIEAEIDKCQVRCANCHQRRTARQFGWYRLGPVHASAPVAQRIEHWSSEPGVGGSIPSGRTPCSTDRRGGWWWTPICAPLGYSGE